MRLWIRGLISRREGVKNPTRLWYSVGTFCLIDLVLIQLLYFENTCLIVQVKEWREKNYVFGYFYLIWKDESFAYLPKRMRSKSSSSLSKIIWWVRLILKFLKMVLRREKRPHRVKKRSEVD